MSSEVDCLVEKHSSDDWAMSAICLDRFTLVVVKRLLDPTPIPGGLIVHNLEYQLNNVQGRQNHNQRRFAWGNGTAGNGGAHNRAGNANAGQGINPNPDYFKDKTLLMQAQKNGAVLNEEELLFLASKQGNTFDADIECDAFDSDVDDESTAQSIFMQLVLSGVSKSTSWSIYAVNLIWRMDDQWPKCQPALYDGRWNFLSLHQVPVIVPSSEEELELAEATRNKLHVKMNDSTCVEKRVNITPPNYSKENFMATFTPQTQLTPEQVFWSLDLAKRKAEELKANATPLPVLPPTTVYPPNTPAHLVPRNVPQYKSSKYWSFTEVRAMKAVFENLEAEVDQNEIDLRSGEIERKNLLITNENSKIVHWQLAVQSLGAIQRKIGTPASYKVPFEKNTPPKVLPTKQWKPTGRLLPLGRQCPLVRSTALKSDCLPADPQETITPVAYNLACTNQPDPNCNWGSYVQKSPFHLCSNAG
ncbi:hypothetical protein Tco_1182098 [Tanacetum coccineum]